MISILDKALQAILKMLQKKDERVLLWSNASGGTVIGTAFRGAVCQSDGIQFGKGYSKDHLDKNAVERPSFVIPVKIFAVKGVI